MSQPGPDAFVNCLPPYHFHLCCRPFGTARTCRLWFPSVVGANLPCFRPVWGRSACAWAFATLSQVWSLRGRRSSDYPLTALRRSVDGADSVSYARRRRVTIRAGLMLFAFGIGVQSRISRGVLNEDHDGLTFRVSLGCAPISMRAGRLRCAWGRQAMFAAVTTSCLAFRGAISGRPSDPASRVSLLPPGPAAVLCASSCVFSVTSFMRFAPW